LKTYAYSIIYALILVVINYFHFRVERLIASVTGTNFGAYIIYGFFIAYGSIAVIKAFIAKKNQDTAVVLLTMGTVFFFLISRTMLSYKLGILELFILGIIMAWEGKKSKTPLLFIIMAVTAALVELASNLSLGSQFYYLDAWRNALIILSGYIATQHAFPAK
jgi:hypothetical protein